MHTEKRRYGQDPGVVVRSKAPTFNAPLSRKWSEPARVFTCSWSDFFIEEADPWRADAWDVIRRTPHLTYQILTKRSERIRDHLPPDWGDGWAHVWLGVTVEGNRYRYRLDDLLATPAVVRFVSMEPMLEAINLADIVVPEGILKPLVGLLWEPCGGGRPGVVVKRPRGPRLDWVIVGGESGPGARPMRLEWARSVVEQCKAASVPCFIKQLHIDGRISKDPAEWPEDLRAREMPAVPHA